MADQRNGGIVWTDATWNLIRGCSRVSEGCRNCYAERMAARFCSQPGMPYHGLVESSTGRWTGHVRLVPEQLETPLTWRRPRRVFVNSMSDLFHEDLPFDRIDQVFGIMAACPQHTFQILTKRPERMRDYLAQDRREEWAYAGSYGNDLLFDQIDLGPRALPNVWVGVSVENQETADKRIPFLLETLAAVRWLSCEPLLGPVDLSREILSDRCGGSYPFPFLPEDCRTHRIDQLDWVVVGGESGPGARPMHPDWARGLRDQCSAAGVPFLFKQWGEWAPAMGDLWWHPLEGGPQFRTRAGSMGTHAFGDGYGAVRIGKKAAGRSLDGQVHDGYPVVTP
ncbi:DUF5131 family protein [Mesoterricola silvestris]|uniref:Phage Gp37/Gp68 family protein n=1 Tax=Mesoterricola silvestris TaxID=2927979 RepID=A0AA48K9B6_9BACT|nr:phage Gp37/Gp68 family protein [Mesoterricola silvestris]BDU72935.1 hypothetical protein METEAL_21090 [Mesoterricola silvestris]